MKHYEPTTNDSEDFKFKETLEILEEIADDVEKRDGTCKLPTKIKTLDKLIWGLHRKELLVLAARPSHGKSSLVHNIAINVSEEGAKTVILSLEMSRQSVMEHLVCIKFGIHGFNLRTGVLEEKMKFMNALSKVRTWLVQTPITIIDSQGKTIEEVRRVVKKLTPDVLMIDHVQKIKSKGYPNKYEALADYVNSLQTVAIENNLAVVLASQINRTGAKDGNPMDNLKGSGDIEEAADTILTLKWIRKENLDYHDPTEYEIVCQKQKHGPTDKITINFNGATFKFTDRFDNSKIPVTPNLTLKKDWNHD